MKTVVDEVLELFLQAFSGLNPEDLLTGPDPSLGTQIWVYDASGNRIELTDINNQGGAIQNRVGAGFGNPANKYAWSSAIYNSELYIGTFNTFLDYRGTIAAYIRIQQGSKVGSEALASSNLLSAVTNNEFFPTILDSQGGEIWKYTPGVPGDPGSAGGTWSKVYDAADVPELGPDVAGFRNMVVFGGKLYAASSSSLIFDILSINQDQPTTISVYDGSSWSRLSGGPLNDPNNSSIRTMKVVGEDLLIGTENAETGGQLWRYDASGNWTRFTFPDIVYTANTGSEPLNSGLVATTSSIYDSATFGAATGDIIDLDSAIGENSGLTELTDTFLVGLWQPYGLFLGKAGAPESELIQIISPANLLAWGEGSFNTNATPIGQGGFDNGVMKMETYNGYLYVGSVNYTGGTSLFRISLQKLNERLATEGVNFDSGSSNGWQVLTTDGFRSFQDSNPQTVGIQIAPGINLTDNVTDLVKVDGGISTYSWSMKVVNGKLYVGDFSGDPGTARLFEILDEGGSLTVNLVSDAFGAEAYGLRTMQAYTPSDQTSALTNGIGSTNLIIGDADPFDSEIGLFNRLDPSRQVLIANDARGGSGDDILFGRLSKNRIWGREGEDLIVGFNRDDTFYGEDDQDVLIGGIGRDLLYGGEQSDLIWGDLPSLGGNSLAEGLLLQLRALLAQNLDPTAVINSTSTLSSVLDSLSLNNPAVAQMFNELQYRGLYWGENEAESLQSFSSYSDEDGEGSIYSPGDFQDQIYGDNGEDILIGGLGNDRLYGGQNNDWLLGQAGGDLLFGEDGNDQLEGGRGSDSYYGGRGSDIYDLRISIATINSSVSPMDTQLVPDTTRDTIIIRRQDFESTKATEYVFGFESGIDRVGLSQFGTKSVILNGTTATISVDGRSIDLVKKTTNNSEILADWSISDFVTV